MNTTIIMTNSNSQNGDANAIHRSLVSVLENTIKPINLCLVFDDKVNNNNWAVVNAILGGGCCGSTPAVESIENGVVTLTNHKYDINFAAVKLNKMFNHELKNYALSKFKDSTDIFFTLSIGTIYAKDYMEKTLAKFDKNIVKGVYSDYIEDGKNKFLPSFNLMMNAVIPVKEIAFRNEGKVFKSDNYTLLSELYFNGVIRHIPEFLFAT